MISGVSSSGDFKNSSLSLNNRRPDFDFLVLLLLTQLFSSTNSIWFFMIFDSFFAIVCCTASEISSSCSSSESIKHLWEVLTGIWSIRIICLLNLLFNPNYLWMLLRPDLHYYLFRLWILWEYTNLKNLLLNWTFCVFIRLEIWRFELLLLTFL